MWILLEKSIIYFYFIKYPFFVHARTHTHTLHCPIFKSVYSIVNHSMCMQKITYMIILFVCHPIELIIWSIVWHFPHSTAHHTEEPLNSESGKENVSLQCDDHLLLNARARRHWALFNRFNGGHQIEIEFDTYLAMKLMQMIS